MQFDDSIENNVAVVEELYQGLTPEKREKARFALAAIESIFNKLRRDYPRDGAIIIGTAYAAFKISERFVNGPKESDKNGGDNLIELLS